MRRNALAACTIAAGGHGAGGGGPPAEGGVWGEGRDGLRGRRRDARSDDNRRGGGRR